MALEISSENNSKIKLVRKLRYKRARDSIGKFTIEGINLVFEAVNQEIQLDFILISKSGSLEDKFVDVSDASGADTFVVDDSIFDTITDAEHGVGILAVLSKKSLPGVNAFPLNQSDNILILDRLQDPGNMGTILRTAFAAGYKRIFAIKGCADIFSSKVLRASAGAALNIPIIYVNDIESLFKYDEIRSRKIAVTVTTGGTPYYDSEISSNTAIVIGNEGNGISSELIEASDIKISIPMYEGVESLNAAVSAAIIMYERVRCKIY